MQFDPVFGVLVSASDDGLCRVWDIREEFPPSEGSMFNRVSYGCRLRLHHDGCSMEHKSSTPGQQSTVRTTLALLAHLSVQWSYIGMVRQRYFHLV